MFKEPVLQECYEAAFCNQTCGKCYQSYQLNGHEFEQTPADSEGQGSLVCCSLGGEELDMTELLNNNDSMAPLKRFPHVWSFKDSAVHTANIT